MVVVKVDATVDDLCQLSWLGSSDKGQVALGVVLWHASWNALPIPLVEETIRMWTISVMRQQGWIDTSENRTADDSVVIPFGAAVCVDASAESVQRYIGDNVHTNDLQGTFNSPLPPYDLPAIAIVSQLLSGTPLGGDQSLPRWNFVSIRATDILRAIRLDGSKSSRLYSSTILRPIQAALARVERQFQATSDLWHAMTSARYQGTALRIFIAGDRSSAGKSSVCLGILGSLIASGFATPETLAYIKPATQSESTQLIQLYCEQQGIQCVAVGPLVYYRGFTRAFLAGETDSTEELLRRCCDAVDEVSRGKRVVLIDGVGFPSVGSICGTSNAAVARACGYPRYEPTASVGGSSQRNDRMPLGVVLVGGSGVGAAIDSFNLNASYFEHQATLPVLGGIFNKLSREGYYSLESCRSQVTTYFQTSREQIEKGRQPFGFVPTFPPITGKDALDHIDDFVQIFRQHVDVTGILDAAQRVKLSGMALSAEAPTTAHSAQKSALQASASQVLDRKSRQEIEELAIAAGAAPSA